jgi:DNA-directed RNA polymerase specialized sigma24 family protein
MYLLNGGRFSEREIAEFEGIEVGEVDMILAQAMKKIRVKFRRSLMELG